MNTITTPDNIQLFTDAALSTGSLHRIASALESAARPTKLYQPPFISPPMPLTKRTRTLSQKTFLWGFRIYTPQHKENHVNSLPRFSLHDKIQKTSNRFSNTIFNRPRSYVTASKGSIHSSITPCTISQLTGWNRFQASIPLLAFLSPSGLLNSLSIQLLVAMIS